MIEQAAQVIPFAAVYRDELATILNSRDERIYQENGDRPAAEDDVTRQLERLQELEFQWLTILNSWNGKSRLSEDSHKTVDYLKTLGEIQQELAADFLGPERTGSRTGDDTPSLADEVTVRLREVLDLQEAGLYDIGGRMRLMGLALSGGGIRSATFNLGVLQALAQLGLLRYCDYLSTVSGGGYIGSWLTAWISRECSRDGDEAQQAEGPPEGRGAPASPSEPQTPREQGIRRVESLLGSGSHRAKSDQTAKEAPAIGFLRDYSNYITPKYSALSGDTWTIVSTYSRNLFLTLLLLVLSFSVVLLVPRWLAPAIRTLAGSADPDGLVLPLAILALLAFAIIFIGINLVQIASRDRLAKATRSAGYFQADLAAVQFKIIAPLAAGALLACLWFTLPHHFQALEHLPRPAAWAFGGAAFFAFLSCIESAAGWSFSHKDRPQVDSDSGERPAVPGVRTLWRITSAATAGAIGGLLCHAVADWMKESLQDPHLSVVSITLGPPLMIIAGMVTVTLYVGLIGRRLSPEIHEWWLRLGGWLAIYGAVWVTWFGIALGSPRFIDLLGNHARGWNLGLAASWLMTSGLGVLAGNSGGTGGKEPNQLMNLVARIGPHVFMVGFVVLLAVGWDHVLTTEFGCDPQSSYWSLTAECTRAELLTTALCAAAALFLSFGLDINLFSLHYFYQNRLVRCYLGASRENGTDPRQAQPFTGFDPRDDIPLCKLNTGCGPYHLINAALNIVQGDKLAWQQRKAASFVFTPKYCGYQVWNEDPHLLDAAFRRTEDFANSDNGQGPLLGTAMAVSGAAFSPNMGYHSSPAVAFLLTVFGVRLGLWIGNPRHPTGYTLNSPRFALNPLFAELFGLTNEKRRFCNLSDGGHFENLGIYELARRRCRFILAIDAGADEKFGFEDLGNAIRKCRVDLGVEIAISTADIRPNQQNGRGQRHCAVGRIAYPDGTAGTLLYIKPTLTGNEPADILNYAADHAEFPHQSTLDQWFDEPQFESYRKLGQHIAHSVLARAVAEARPDAGPSRDARTARIDKTELFRHLRQQWYPSAPLVASTFSHHAQTLDVLLERVRTNQDLAFLDAQIFPEWNAFIGGNAGAGGRGLPPAEAQRRAGFYYCNSLLQLMESVYLDLNLEETSEHPDHRGWMNLFRHWAWSDMVRATWAICASTYGARFQSFCETQLGLCLGDVVVGDPHAYRGAAEPDLNFFEKELITQILACSRNDHKPESLAVRIIRVEVNDAPEKTPEHACRESIRPTPTTARAMLSFPCGFVLTTSDGSGTLLRYFRIQNHLRKTGLGARALDALFRTWESGSSAAPPAGVKLFFVPPDAPERPKARDIMHFLMLCRAHKAQIAKGGMQPDDGAED